MVEHRPGIAEVMGSNPIEAFFLIEAFVSGLSLQLTVKMKDCLVLFEVSEKVRYMKALRI